MAGDTAGAAPLDLSAAAAAVVAGLLGSTVRTSQQEHRGIMTFKCRVRTERGDDVMVRFYPAGRGGVVHQEPDLLDRCRAAGLPVAITLGDSRTGPAAPLSYVAYRRIEGEPLADRLPQFNLLQRTHLASALAQHLSRLQTLRFEGAGELASATGAREPAWAGFVARSMHEGVEAVRSHALLPPALIAALDRAVKAGPPPAVAPAAHSLVWGDINFENILVTPDAQVAGLIDFEGCMSGDPLATLGYGYAVHGEDPFFQLVLQAALGLAPAQEDERVAWYALLRAMRLARYAHLALPTGRPRDPLVQIVPGMVPALALLLNEHTQALLPRRTAR